MIYLYVVASIHSIWDDMNSRFWQFKVVPYRSLICSEHEISDYPILRVSLRISSCLDHILEYLGNNSWGFLGFLPNNMTEQTKTRVLGNAVQCCSLALKMSPKKTWTSFTWSFSFLWCPPSSMSATPHPGGEWLVGCSSSFHTLHLSPFYSPRSHQQTPTATGNGSYKGNRESFYIRLLLVLAAIYDSTGSSDVGYGARGEQPVSSKAI